MLTRNILPAVTLLAANCCPHTGNDDVGGTGNTSSSSSSASETPTSPTGETEEPFDPTPWVGSYHYRSVFTPFGEPGPWVGVAHLGNLEIRADFSAELVFDQCNIDPADVSVAHYGWGPDGSGGIAFTPGAGESSLRYWALTDLTSLTASFEDDCGAIRLEIRSEANGSSEVFDPGRACWINRCEDPPDEVYIDYCEGQALAPCD